MLRLIGVILEIIDLLLELRNLVFVKLAFRLTAIQGQPIHVLVDFA